MSYLHIDNLYKAKDILEFRRCYAMEKVHGTSAHIKYKDDKVNFFVGGVDTLAFVNLFDKDFLLSKFREMNKNEVTIYGEAYGGKCQGMSVTYGKQLKFIAFEVQIGKAWLNVPIAEKIAGDFNIEFMPYSLISTDIEVLTQERDADSIVAIRNGIGEGKKREGIVLRPPFEVIKQNGERIIAKYKRDDFIETNTPRNINVEQIELLTQAEDIANEWVTEMRLTHILDKLPKPLSTSDMPDIIKSMLEDVAREGREEYVDSKQARKAMSKRTVTLFKQRMEHELYGKE